MKYYVIIFEIIDGFQNACDDSEFVEFNSLTEAKKYISNNSNKLKNNQTYCIYDEFFNEIKNN